jgi:hypothetical protein
MNWMSTVWPKVCGILLWEGSYNFNTISRAWAGVYRSFAIISVKASWTLTQLFSDLQIATEPNIGERLMKDRKNCWILVHCARPEKIHNNKDDYCIRPSQR